MGITIHYKLGQQKEEVKRTLDRTQELALRFKNEGNLFGIPVEVSRISDNKLAINIGNCETLVFDFNLFEEYEKQKEGTGWNYAYAVLSDSFGLDKDLLYSAGFCKTQFADNIAEHKFVAELIRIVASYCHYADVSDEGDYYHTGVLDDASSAIEANGKLIDSIGGMLKGAGFKEDQITKGGETKIKSRKSKE